MVAKSLNPIHINSHSGSDDFTEAEADEFFRIALLIEEELNVQVSHETHRVKQFLEFKTFNSF